MTDKFNFKSVTLKNETYDKLNNLSTNLIKGIKLSKSKTVEKLIDKASSDSLGDSKGLLNENSKAD
tara:strand:+ start:450 stop:647 length:198 start_codon:yes stop_codon:yes gene_type:complete